MRLIAALRSAGLRERAGSPGAGVEVRRMRPRLCIAAMALAASAAQPGAQAAGDGPRVGPQGVWVVTVVAYHYVPGDSLGGPALRVPQGDRLLLVNGDALGAHNLVSLDVVDERPLFDSGEQTMLGDHAEVRGVPDLGPGNYVFWCSVHGFDSMNGVLQIVPLSA